MNEVFDSLIKMVPQFYTTEESKTSNIATNSITICDKEYFFNSIVQVSPLVQEFLNEVKDIKESHIPNIESKKIKQEILVQWLVKKWLKVKGYDFDWTSMFDYVIELESRTYENSSIGFTFIINPEDYGNESLFQPQYQKYLDVLSETRYTYFYTNDKWEYLDYNFIDTTQISHLKQYKFVPEFIYPYQQILQSEKQLAVTKTKTGDLLIYNNEGVLATRRKGHWFIYQPTDLWACIKSLSPTNKIGENILELLLDLSYRRHGALLIFCEDCNLNSCISNPSAIIFGKSTSRLHSLLAPKIQEICITCPDVKDISKPLILELASIDGAIIFDKETGNIKAFGAMINHHSNVTMEQGARSTAALSAFHHNMIPFKVSSDGDITLYHNHHNKTGSHELVKISFL